MNQRQYKKQNSTYFVFDLNADVICHHHGLTFVTLHSYYNKHVLTKSCSSSSSRPSAAAARKVVRLWGRPPLCARDLTSNDHHHQHCRWKKRVRKRTLIVWKHLLLMVIDNGSISYSIQCFTLIVDQWHQGLRIVVWMKNLVVVFWILVLVFVRLCKCVFEYFHRILYLLISICICILVQ